MKKGPKKRRLLHPDTIILLKQIGLGVLILLSIAIIVTSIWYGTRLESLTITEIEVAGGETIAHDFLREQIEQQLEGDYLRLIPRRFAYLYPKDDIIAALAGIPRLKDISLIREGGKKVTLIVTEYEPAALWCNNEETESCLLLDETTFAFAAAPALAGETFLRYVSIGDEPKIGETILTSSELATYKVAASALEAKGWRVKQVSVDGARDAFLLLKGGEGSEIILSLKDDGAVIADNFRTVINSEEFNDLEPGGFQYMDLRFGNKVFVNRTEEIAPVASSTDVGFIDFEVDLEPTPAPVTPSTTMVEVSGTSSAGE